MGAHEGLTDEEYYNRIVGMAKKKQEIRKRNAAQLKDGYSSSKRALEIFAITAFYTMWVFNIYRVWDYSQGLGSDTVIPTLIMSIFAGVLVSDFMSGLVHWGADTWGSINTPVLGTFIRSFREHHVDAMAMCNHDFIETNGDNHLICLPCLAWLTAVPISLEGSFVCPGSYAWFVYCLVLTLFVAYTNQTHKLAHQIRPHPVARLLQNCHIILTRQGHAIHHQGLHDKHYCITVGWLNPALDAIDFWRKLEWAIERTTGYIPRENDVELLGEKNE